MRVKDGDVTLGKEDIVIWIIWPGIYVVTEVQSEIGENLLDGWTRINLPGKIG